MKKTYCNVCGVEISIPDRVAHTPVLSVQAIIGKDMDICPKCRLIGASMDPAEVLLAAWKKAATMEDVG